LQIADLRIASIAEDAPFSNLQSAILEQPLAPIPAHRALHRFAHADLRLESEVAIGARQIDAPVAAEKARAVRRREWLPNSDLRMDGTPTLRAA
jgi:hypothetical protein